MTTLPAVPELVPHQAPMLGLDRLTAWRPEHAEGQLTIRADNPFLRDGHIDTVMAMEYMAQCVAACLGMEAYQGGGNVRVGMVIACRKMTIAQPHLELGRSYRVTASQVRGNDSISHYDATIETAGSSRAPGEDDENANTPVASCTMTLVHGEKPPE